MKNSDTDKEQFLEENAILKEEIAFYERFDIDKCIDESILILEMANIHKKDSNLPMNLFIDFDGDGKYQHGARIKVQNNTNQKIQKDNFFSLSIDDNPILLTKDVDIKLKGKDLRSLLDFIRIYEKELMNVWYGLMTIEQFDTFIKKNRI